MMFFQFIRICSDALHPSQGITLFNVIECEESIMLMAAMSEAEMNGGAVARGAEHRFHHDLGHVDLLPPRGGWYWLLLPVGLP